MSNQYLQSHLVVYNILHVNSTSETMLDHSGNLNSVISNNDKNKPIAPPTSNLGHRSIAYMSIIGTGLNEPLLMR